MSDHNFMDEIVFCNFSRIELMMIFVALGEQKVDAPDDIEAEYAKAHDALIRKVSNIIFPETFER